MPLVFDRGFDARHGEPVPVARDVLRVTARNPGPFTFQGTNTYLVGRSTLAVIDPGPDDDAHLAALLQAVGGRPVSHILVSHTHKDHSPLARRLANATGAPMLAEGPHRPARNLRVGEMPSLDAGGDTDFIPDRRLIDGEAVEGPGWTLRTVLTPGHTANHAAFALDGSGLLFSADHVMAWSTTVVAPPDGSMRDYMASLDRLIARADATLLPGHGGPVRDPATFLPALKAHRLAREAAILASLEAGARTIPEIVRTVYADVDPRLHGAAGLSTLAHLEHLIERGLVVTPADPSPSARFSPATATAEPVWASSDASPSPRRDR